MSCWRCISFSGMAKVWRGEVVVLWRCRASRARTMWIFLKDKSEAVVYAMTSTIARIRPPIIRVLNWPSVWVPMLKMQLMRPKMLMRRWGRNMASRWKSDDVVRTVKAMEVKRASRAKIKAAMRAELGETDTPDGWES